jgi:membrane protease subunit HflC
MAVNLTLLKGLGTKTGGHADKAWVAGMGLILLILTVFSFTSIEPGQVAVRINNVTGAQTSITQPGWVLRLPMGVHSLHVLDASPQTFRMQGNENIDDINVRRLTVRASDGSNFHFEDTTLIFQVKGDEAVQAIKDSGSEYGYRHWIKPFARTILRDEFGRESTITVSNPASYGAAANRSQERINSILGEHGVTVTQIVTPRPKFNDSYEKLIEERNSMSNQLQVIESDLARAETDRARILAEVDRDQNKLIQERRANLEQALATAVAAQAETIREADTYRIEKIGQGQASLSASEQQALELQGQLDAQYRAQKAEIEAFRTQTVERVMQRLGERLEGVTINIQPYADDATPSRVKLDQ